MRLRIVSTLSLVCATALLVTGCNQSIVTTPSGTPGGNGASYVFAENYSANTQQGTILSFPLASIGPANSASLAPSSTTTYPGAITGVNISNGGSGYLTPPTIIIPPPTACAAGCTQATAVATLSAAGAINAVTITYAGSGYTAAPGSVFVSAPPAGGQQAILAAVIASTTPSSLYLPQTVTTVAPGPPPVTTITYLNADTFYTGLEMDGTADGRIFYASYPISTPNVVTIHFNTAPNPNVVTAETGAVTSLILQGGGAGYAVPPPVVIAPPNIPACNAPNTSTSPTCVQDTATATATLSSSTGPVSAIALSAGGNGAGYASAPTVTIAPPTTFGGTQATASATISNSTGPVTSVVFSANGSGYSTVTGPPGSLPNVTTVLFSAPTIAGGTQATGTPVVNSSGQITGVTINNPGAEYTAAPTITFSGTGNGAAATAVVAAPYGAVTGVSLVNAGSDYTGAPAVTFSAPQAGGTTAAGAATVAAPYGAVTALTLTSPGTGYTAPPTVTFIGPNTTGSGAAATVALLGTTSGVSVVNVVNGGIGYISAPTVSFTGGGGSGAVATATASGGVVSAVTVTTTGTAYTSAPTVVFTGGGPPATATTTLNGTGGVTLPVVTFAGFNYSSVPAVSFGTAPTGGTAATATAVLSNGTTGSVTGFTAFTPGSGYTSVPTITIAAGGPQTVATATAVPGSVINTASATLTNAGSGYTAPPVPTFSGGGTGATGTTTLNSSGGVATFTVTNGGNGFTSTPFVTFTPPQTTNVGATATSTIVGPDSIGLLTQTKAITYTMLGNFVSMAVDRQGDTYISEATTPPTMLEFPNIIGAGGAGAGTFPLTLPATFIQPAVGTPVLYTTFGAPNTGTTANPVYATGTTLTTFNLMTTDFNNNLYTYVAGSGVINEIPYNPVFTFAATATNGPGTNGFICAIGASACVGGNLPAITHAITISNFVTNVSDMVIDDAGNIYVLGDVPGSSPLTPIVAEFPAITTTTAATLSPAPIRTITGALTGFNAPGAIAVDNVDDLFVEDAITGPSNFNDFLEFGPVVNGNTAPILKFTDNVANTNPSGAAAAALTGYGLAVY